MDREFDDSVLTVKLVDLGCGAVEVGEESEVTPVGPQLQSVLVSEAETCNPQPCPSTVRSRADNQDDSATA